MKKALVALLTVVWVMMLSMSVYAASAAQLPDGYVLDKAEVFSSSELEHINATVEQYFGNSDCKVYILTLPETYSYTDYDVYDMMDEYGLSGNMVILSIKDNVFHNYDLYVFGKADSRISYSESDAILDAEGVYSSIKSGDYYSGALEFIALSYEYYSVDWSRLIVVAVLVGAVVAGVVGICVICSYRKKLRSTIYPLDRYAKLSLIHSDDMFMGSFVTKRVIQSSGGGRSGVGGSSGHRGGGGHRGGR